MDNESLKRVFTLLAIGGFENTIRNQAHLDNNALQILNAIKDLISNMKTECLDCTISYYRARIVRINDIKPENGFHFNDNGELESGFCERESGLAPRSLVKAGRINHQWESIWYISDNPYTAMAEVRPSLREQISLASYNITDDISIPILDFSVQFPNVSEWSSDYDVQEIFVLVQKILTLPSYDEHTYYISNVIVDMIKEVASKGTTNIAGIKYKSFYGSGSNIALWNIDKGTLNFLGSKLYLYYSSNQAFLNAEDKSIIDNSSAYNSQINMDYSNVIDEVNKIYKRSTE